MSDQSLQQYIKDLVNECYSANSDDIRSIISDLENVQESITRWTVRPAGDTFYAVQDFIDDVMGVLDESIKKAESLLEDSLEEEREDTYDHGRFDYETSRV